MSPEPISKSWLKGSVGVVLLLIAALTLSGTTVWHLAKQNNRSAWEMAIHYEVNGEPRIERLPYTGLTDTIKAVQRIESDGGTVTRIQSGNEETDLTNPEISIEHIHEVIRRQLE